MNSITLFLAKNAAAFSARSNPLVQKTSIYLQGGHVIRAVEITSGSGRGELEVTDDTNGIHFVHGSAIIAFAVQMNPQQLPIAEKTFGSPIRSLHHIAQYYERKSAH